MSALVVGTDAAKSCTDASWRAEATRLAKIVEILKSCGTLSFDPVRCHNEGFCAGWRSQAVRAQARPHSCS
jgi:hypothetical protein